jgi:hypothetical protein
MKTIFVRDTGLPDWSYHRGAAEAWRSAYYERIELVENRLFGRFYVEPFMIAHSLELFVKALAGYDDLTSFKAHRYGHNTRRILTERAHIPSFAKISGDPELMEIIGEYEKALDVKYGEMAMNLDNSEKQQMLDAIGLVRDELADRRGTTN